MAYTPEQEDYDDLYNESGQKKRKSAAGRELIRWDPDKDQLALLCVDYVCVRESIAIPWDLIAKQMGHAVNKPNLTGEAVKQHLAKLYKFREMDGHPVPPKLDRNQRRKALPTIDSASSTPAPARGRGRKVTQNENDDVAPATPVKPGRSLLFKKPDPKAKRPKKEAATPKPSGVGRGGGRKRKTQDQDDEDVIRATQIKLEEDEDGNFGVPVPRKKPSGPRGTKRGRKSKQADFDEEEEEDDDPETSPSTPSKGSKLRSMPVPDYSKQMVQDDDDSEDEETMKGTSVKQGSGSSPGSGQFAGRNVYGQPPPTYGMQMHAYSGYPQRGNASNIPLDSSLAGGVHGGGGLQYHQPAPQMRTANGYDHGYGGMPYSNNNFGRMSFSQKGPLPTSQADMAFATYPFTDAHDPSSAPYHRDFGSTAANDQTLLHNFDHDNGTSYKTDSHSTNAGDQLRSTSTLHLNTDLDGTMDFPSPKTNLKTSPSSMSNTGQTGITPDMVQIGFQDHDLRQIMSKNASFDSSYQSEYQSGVEFKDGEYPLDMEEQQQEQFPSQDFFNEFTSGIADGDGLGIGSY